MCSIQLTTVQFDNTCVKKQGSKDLPNKEKLYYCDDTKPGLNKEIDFIDTYSSNPNDRRLRKDTQIGIVSEGALIPRRIKSVEHLHHGFPTHMVSWCNGDNYVTKEASTDLNGNITGKFKIKLESKNLDFISGGDGRYYLHGSLPNSVEDIPIQARPKFVEFLRKCRDLLHKYEEK